MSSQALPRAAKSAERIDGAIMAGGVIVAKQRVCTQKIVSDAGHSEPPDAVFKSSEL